jgi:hypothetical protein
MCGAEHCDHPPGFVGPVVPNRRRLAGLVSMEISVLRSSSAMRPKAKISSATLFQASTSQRRPVMYAGWGKLSTRCRIASGTASLVKAR